MPVVIDQVQNQERVPEQKQIDASSLYRTFPLLQIEYPIEEEWIKRYLELYAEKTSESFYNEMFDKLTKRKREYDRAKDPHNIERNHSIVKAALVDLAKLLEKHNIEYYLMGPMTGYLKYGIPPKHTYHGIHIAVPYSEKARINSIFRRNDIKVDDSITPPGKKSFLTRALIGDPKQVLNLNSAKIAVTYYAKKEDGTITVRDGDEEKEIPFDVTTLLLSETPVTLDGITIPIFHPEFAAAKLTGAHHWEYREDLTFLKDHGNLEKIGRISECLQSSQQNPQTDQNGNTYKLSNGHPIVPREGDTNGFISNTIITTLALISFVLSFIGIAILYLLQI